MKLIDRYLLKEVGLTFLFACAAFCSLTTGGIVYQVLNLINKNDAPWIYAIELIALSIPAVLVPLLPMSMLMATLIAFGKLSANSEITALKSGGVSFVRIIYSTVFLAFIMSAVSFSLAQFVTPWANTKYDYILRTYVDIKDPSQKNITKYVVLSKKTTDDRFYILFAKEYDREKELLRGVTVSESNANTLKQLIFASEASYNGTNWVMNNTENYGLLVNPAHAFSTNDQVVLPITIPPKHVVTSLSDPTMSSFFDLIETAKIMKADKHPEYPKFETEVFDRTAIPFACLIFAMVGAPLGMQSNRSSSSVGLGISLLIIMAYFTVYSFTISLGKNGVVDGFIAAWTPNFLGMIAGTFLIIRATRK